MGLADHVRTNGKYKTFNLIILITFQKKNNLNALKMFENPFFGFLSWGKTGASETNFDHLKTGLNLGHLDLTTRPPDDMGPGPMDFRYMKKAYRGEKNNPSGEVPYLKLTAKAPENRGPLEVWRFRAWKPPFLGANC